MVQTGFRGMAGTQATPKDRLFSKDAVIRSDQMPPSGDTAPQATRSLIEACDLAGAMAVWELYLLEP